MSNDKIAGALFRIIGSVTVAKGEPNPATMDDAYAIIETMLDSEEFRSRCAALASLSSTIEVEKRKDLARALLILMSAKFNPREPAPENNEEEHRKFVATTHEYSALAAPKPETPWRGHFKADYKKKSTAAQWVTVSPYMATMIQSFESLFGIRGSLIVP